MSTFGELTATAMRQVVEGAVREVVSDKLRWSDHALEKFVLDKAREVYEEDPAIKAALKEAMLGWIEKH